MKKKRFSVLKTVLCTVLMLALTCGSVVLANEVAPLVSSLLKDDYVYVANFGEGNYNGVVPIEKNGVYYLPWRQFLNDSDVENDKIKYDNGTVTVDIWSRTHKIVNTMVDPNATNEERVETTIPGELVWSTSCSIGNKEVLIAGDKYTLTNAPYIENGTTFVPYEYIRLLSNYEKSPKMSKKDFSHHTNVFAGTFKYGFDSMENRFYIDDIQIDDLPREKIPTPAENTLLVVTGYTCTDADVSLQKTGFRTKFNAKFEFVDFNNSEDTGNAEVVLNKVTRIYSKGSDIEGLFTVKVDGQTIYENEKGYITDLPTPAGTGIVGHGETIVKIGHVKLRIFFFGLGTESHDAYSALSNKNREIEKKADTKMIGIFPSEVRIDGNTVTRTDKDNYFQYNIQDEYALLRFGFDDYTEESETWFNNYNITRNENSKIKVIDENSFSGHFFLENQNVRVDSFDAILTLLPDNKFEFKSNDGKYIIRGTTGEFIPQWQWTEDQKNSPVPQVVMINE